MTVTSPAAGHELVPHTADVILHAWGPTRAACLGQAAVGLLDAALADAAPAATDVDVSLEEPDDTELLLRILEEVLFLVDGAGMVPVGADLRDEGRALTGTLRVVPVDAVADVAIVAKGVSRSGASCRRSDDGWECWAIVDV